VHQKEAFAGRHGSADNATVQNTPANFRRKSVLGTLTVADRSRENRGYAIISDSGENRSRIGENRGLATLETEGPSCENTFDDPVLTCPAAEKQVTPVKFEVYR